MRYREYVPHPLLSPFVRSIWSLEVADPTSFGQPMRIVPDGVVELVFHYRTPFAMSFGGGRFSAQPASFALSQVRRFVEIRPAGDGGFIAVRFEPWGAYQFLPIPIRELADGMVATKDLWGREGAEVEERLALATRETERVSLLERFLLAQLSKYRKVDVEPLVREVWRRKGQVRVVDLCTEIGIGQRKLERTFASAVGLPPKSYARLCRFLFACEQLKAGGSISLTDVGHACGYYDQAHFIADFNAYCGVTPGEFQKRDNVSFLALD